NFRMAELHAKESPQRIWELETYGALFDRGAWQRTADGGRSRWRGGRRGRFGGRRRGNGLRHGFRLGFGFRLGRRRRHWFGGLG
ncbi:hypothetical protein ACFUYE_32380, partial [Micromonospora humida]|uniref:hypothetical protein n=1 Tax=Micromonospora humida TaxID=2809018 RepID=UPI0036714438